MYAPSSKSGSEPFCFALFLGDLRWNNPAIMQFYLFTFSCPVYTWGIAFCCTSPLFWLIVQCDLDLTWKFPILYFFLSLTLDHRLQHVVNCTVMSKCVGDERECGSQQVYVTHQRLENIFSVQYTLKLEIASNNFELITFIITLLISGCQQLFHSAVQNCSNPVKSLLLCENLPTVQSQRFVNKQTLEQMHRNGPPKRRKRPSATDGHPQLKGVVLKTVIKKPKKPNSANRKCVLVRLSNGKEMTAYVPGEGHTLQEHNIVLVRGGNTQDLPGVKLKVIRGKYDCAHVKK